MSIETVEPLWLISEFKKVKRCEYLANKFMHDCNLRFGLENNPSIHIRNETEHWLNDKTTKHIKSMLTSENKNEVKLGQKAFRRAHDHEVYSAYTTIVSVGIQEYKLDQIDFLLYEVTQLIESNEGCYSQLETNIKVEDFDSPYTIGFNVYFRD